jgi:hypothetical protein
MSYVKLLLFENRQLTAYDENDDFFSLKFYQIGYFDILLTIYERRMIY